MYNTKKLEALDKELQEKITALIKAYEPRINKAVKEELRQGDTLITGMGICTITDKNGNDIATTSEREKFVRYIEQYQYGGGFVTYIDIMDVTK